MDNQLHTSKLPRAHLGPADLLRTPRLPLSSTWEPRAIRAPAPKTEPTQLSMCTDVVIVTPGSSMYGTAHILEPPAKGGGGGGG